MGNRISKNAQEMRCRALEIYNRIFHMGNLIGLVAGQWRQNYEPDYLPTKTHEATAAGSKDHTIRKALFYETEHCSLGKNMATGVITPQRIFGQLPSDLQYIPCFLSSCEKIQLTAKNFVLSLGCNAGSWGHHRHIRDSK